jgi:exodeoxyribonuclease VII large subunit
MPLTVSELTRSIKALLESQIGSVTLCGEISNLRRQASGHTYFSLKDAHANISGVLFRGDAARNPIQLREGMQVVGSGSLSVYEPRGTYQVIFRKLEEDGIGRLQQAFAALKKKLLAEGLFDPERKKALPQLPATIGFITSPSGAALRDFISILRRRKWHGRLIVLPARVQGSMAAGELAQALARANEDQLCELLVIGRGGGSLEDLWPFNEEPVARAIAASHIPVISAVGHETDFTLSDFVADMRAETPSAAAEWISSAWLEQGQRARRLADALSSVTESKLKESVYRYRMAHAHLKAQHPRNRLDQASLRLDDMQNRLHQALAASMNDLARKQELIKQRFAALHPERQIQQLAQNLRQLKIRLNNNSHRATLQRGYAIIRRPDSAEILQSVSDLTECQPFTVELSDGQQLAQPIPPMSQKGNT